MFFPRKSSPRRKPRFSAAESQNLELRKFGDFIHGGPTDADDIQHIREVLLFEEPEMSKNVRFGWLIALDAAIWWGKPSVWDLFLNEKDLF